MESAKYLSNAFATQPSHATLYLEVQKSRVRCGVHVGCGKLKQLEAIFWKVWKGLIIT